MEGEKSFSCRKNAPNSTVPMTKREKRHAHVHTHPHTPHSMHTNRLFPSLSPSTSHGDIHGHRPLRMVSVSPRGHDTGGPAHWQLLLGEEEQKLCRRGRALGIAQPSNQWEAK